jgi:serine protease Do
VTRGSIGITWNKADKPDLLRALGQNHGVLVSALVPNGPAQKAGIKPEDIILSLNGKPVKDGDDLVNRVADLPIGSPATLTVDRGGKKMDFNLTIGDRAEVLKEMPEYASLRRPEEPEAQETGSAKFGVSIRPLNEVEKDAIANLAKSGVKVTRVEPGSFADDVGLVDGDIIVSINREAVNSVDDVKKVQSALKPGTSVAFRILRSQTPNARSGGRAAGWNSLFLSGTLAAR